MRKKYLSALLFGALIFASAGTFTSCKDYDDDINSLNDRISAVETSVAELEKQIKEGKWITGFEENSAKNGYVLTLSDGSKLEIQNGADGKDGVNGNDGKNGTTWEIDQVTKHWIQISPDGTKTDTGIVAEGQKGDKGDKGDTGLQGPAGQNGKSPKIENGVWVVWNDETGEYVATEYPAAMETSYVVEYPAYYELNMLVGDAKGNLTDEYKKIILPKTAEISSLEVYSLNSEGKLGEPQVTLNLGRAKNDIEFNGVKYQKGEVLVSKSTNLVAQVNPLEADASKYDFALVNSKGETKFTVSKAEANKSEKPLTRAEQTVNKGLWNLSLSVPEGEVISDDGAAYSLQTRSIADGGKNLIASRFEVGVSVGEASTVTPEIVQATLEAGQTVTWSELLEKAMKNYKEWEVVDYYLEIPKKYTAQAEKDGVTLDKEAHTLTIAQAKGTPIKYITLHYLTLDGDHKEKELDLRVVANSNVSFEKAFVYDLNKADKNEVSVKILGNNALDGFVEDKETCKPEYKFANETVTVDGKEIDQEKTDLSEILGDITFNSKLNEEGYNEWTATMTFDKTKVFAEDVNGTVVLKNNKGEILTLNFQVQVVAPTKYDFASKRNAAYFNGTKASAYSEEIQGTENSEYDLYHLYDIKDADKEYIYFSEILPQKTDGQFPTPVLGRAWLDVDSSSDKIIVPKYNGFDGAYSERTMYIYYRPFNNKNLNASYDEFQLTVKSEIYEGTFEYDSKLASQKLNDQFKTVTMKVEDIKALDKFGEKYTFIKTDDSRILGYEVTWDENAQKYLNVSKNSTYNEKGIIEVTRNENQTVVENAQPCVGTISVKDAWGRTKSTKITIIVEKTK